MGTPYTLNTTTSTFTITAKTATLLHGIGHILTAAVAYFTILIKDAGEVFEDTDQRILWYWRGMRRKSNRTTNH